MPLPLSRDLEEAGRPGAFERYGILDAASELSFEDVAVLAKLVCHAPIVLVGFSAAGCRWLKARYGLHFEEAALEQSLCEHVLAEGGMLVIDDLALDARTRTDALVVGEPFLRFFAGVPLRAPEGHLVGALGVMDKQPRPTGLTGPQSEGLQALGRQIMVLMELRRSVGKQEEALRRERQSSRINLNRALASERTSGWLQEARVRAIAAQEAGDVGTFDVDLTAGVTWVSGVFCRIYGLSEGELFPTSVLEGLVVEEDRPISSVSEPPGSEAVKLVTDFRVRRANDQAVRWLSRRAEYIRDEAATPVRLIGTVLDITEPKLVDLRQRALLELGDCARGAATIAETAATASRSLARSLGASRAGYVVIDTLSGSWRVEGDWAATGLSSLVGDYPASMFEQTLVRAALGKTIVVDDVGKAEWLHADRQSYAALGAGACIIAPMVARTGLAGLLFLHNTSARAWSQDEADFTQAITDRAYTYIVKIKAEEEQRLLNQELSHRLKNTLAMVQAIATQTLKGLSDRNVVDAFNQRLLALGTAHDILLQNSWAAARIRAVIEGVLSLHTDLLRFQIRGADLNLGAKAVLSLSMLLHELGTNAVKYGALSNDTGKVLLSWTLDYTAEQAIFVMEWKEFGGPPVRRPAEHGFGSRLMRVGLAGAGNSTLRYESEGLVAEFRAPLTSLTGG